MTIKELQDRRNKLLADAQALVLGESVDAEKRAQANKMLADVDALESDIAVAQRAEKSLAEQRRAGAPPRDNPAGDARDAQTEKAEQREAFRRFVTRGVMHPCIEPRTVVGITTAQDGTTGVGGGAVVPQAFDTMLHEAQLAWGDLVNIVRVLRSDNGAPTKYATVNDTSVTWYEETENVADANTAENPAFTGKLLSTSTIQRPAILVSFAELQDSAFDIDAFMRNTIGKSWFRGLSSLVVNGSTSGNIASLLGIAVAGNTVTATGTVYGLTSGTVSGAATTGEVGYSDFASAYGKLDPAYEPNASWVFNSTLRGHIMGQTNAFGQPLYIPAPNAGALDTILGRPVKLVQAMPNLPATTSAGVYPILYGDFAEGYTLKLVNPGLNIMRLNERYADQLSVGFVPFFRAGGVCTDAGTHPVVAVKVVHS